MSVLLHCSSCRFGHDGACVRRELVAGAGMLLPDFLGVAQCFEAKGWNAVSYGEAIWHFHRAGRTPLMQLILTVGVHGNETAPIEMLGRRLMGWAQLAEGLQLDLWVAVGNLDAVRAGQRFVRYDMNRMFGSDSAVRDWGAESVRARLLAVSLGDAIRSVTACPTVHLDLHTTIRPSLKPTFAIVPSAEADSPLLRWLGMAGLDAAVLSPEPNSTLSSFSAQLGAISCTVELGKAGAFGANDMGLLTGFDQALDHLVRNTEQAWPFSGNAGRLLPSYRVTRELIRTNEQFELRVSADAPNFQPLSVGQLVAIDQGQEIRATCPNEALIFPNPSVALGLRAGLMIAPVEGL